MAYPGPGREVAIVAGLTFMSDFFILLRTYSRLKTRVPFGLDDYLIYVCAMLNFPYLGVNVWGAVKGNQGTFELTTLPLPNLTIYLKSIYISSVLYVTLITLAKFSVLAFYHRIFGKSVRLATMTIFVLQGVWAIICVCLALFRCRPISGSWNVTIPSKCLNFETVVTAAEPFNCALDFAMVVLPVTVIRSLQLSRKQKVTVSAIFLLGSFVGFMCILRIIYTVRGSVDSSGRWVYAQINVGIVCACLPTLKPLVPKNTTVATLVRKVFSSLRTSLRSMGTSKIQSTNVGSDSPSIVNRHNRYRNIDRDTVDTAHLTEAIGGGVTFNGGQDYPMNKIKVRHDVDVV